MDFGQPSQGPQALFRRGLGRIAQACADGVDGRCGVACGGVHTGDAGLGDEVAGERLHLFTSVACRGVVGLHHADGGDPGPGLRMLWRLLHHRLQISQRRCELVVELQEHSTRHAHFEWCPGVVPPRRQCRLRVTDVARVTFGGELGLVARHEPHRERGVARRQCQRAAHLGHVAHARLGGARRQLLEDLLVRAGQVGCRSHVRADGPSGEGGKQTGGVQDQAASVPADDSVAKQRAGGVDEKPQMIAVQVCIIRPPSTASTDALSINAPRSMSITKRADWRGQDCLAMASHHHLNL